MSSDTLIDAWTYIRYSIIVANTRIGNRISIDEKNMLMMLCARLDAVATAIDNAIMAQNYSDIARLTPGAIKIKNRLFNRAYLVDKNICLSVCDACDELA